MVSPCRYDPPYCYGLGVGVAAGRALATPSTVVPPVCQRSPLRRRDSGARKPSSARGPAIPSLGNTAHVRNSGLTCATGDPHARQLVDTQDMLEPTSLSHADDRSQTMGQPHTPKVQTTSPKNGKNRLLWVRWSAIWANPGTRQTRPPTTVTFPRRTAAKSPPQQHDVSILQVASHHLQHQLFRTNKPKSHHKTNTLCPITRSLPGPSTWRAPQEAHPPRTQNPRKQHRQRRSPGIPRESRGRERRRRDLNPRGAMHPYLLSREAHSTGLCDVSSADYFRAFSPRARTCARRDARRRPARRRARDSNPRCHC